MYEVITDQWFNKNGAWKFRDGKNRTVHQKNFTYINVAQQDRTLNIIDYAKHGISYLDVDNAPSFSEVHDSILEFVKSTKAKRNIIIAHNGDAYDFDVWGKSLGELVFLFNFFLACFTTPLQSHHLPTQKK